MPNKTVYYLFSFVGEVTISFQSASSSSLLARISLVGHLIRSNESVTITCQTNARETSSNFTWSKRTYGNRSALSGNNIYSWNEGQYLYGSLTLDYFDYDHCGVYSCQVDTGETVVEIEMPLSIEGTVCTPT